jgi:single-strand DNA-binding protein
MLLLRPATGRGWFSQEGHMRETYMHVAGVVATDPTIRRFDDGRQVMSFRVASTSRRFDSTTKSWVDGPTLWVKVSCWRELAANASECVRKSDRVVVWGRVRTEQWKGEDGGQRSDLAIEAEALGPDLAFGVAKFVRRRRTVSTQTLTAEGLVDTATGELAPVPSPDVPPLPPGFEETDVAVSSVPAPSAAEPGDDEVLDELDDLDEEDAATDGAQPEVTLLASA